VKHRWLRHALVAATILIYALLEHYTNTSGSSFAQGAGQKVALGAALAVAPLLFACLLMARRAPRPRLSILVVCLVAGVVVTAWWPQIERNFALMYLLQQVGVYLLLAFGFGRSLLAGQVPLCTHWAGIVHGPLSEPVQRYTRGVTLAWTVFFVAIAVSSAVIFVAAPLWIWSIFSNFLTLPLAALMFAVEYELRRRRLPWMQRASIADTARAYFASSRNGPAPRY
jgi:uncharacterized membrane protein